MNVWLYKNLSRNVPIKLIVTTSRDIFHSRIWTFYPSGTRVPSHLKLLTSIFAGGRSWDVVQIVGGRRHYWAFSGHCFCPLVVGKFFVIEFSFYGCRFTVVRLGVEFPCRVVLLLLKVVQRLLCLKLLLRLFLKYHRTGAEKGMKIRRTTTLNMSEFPPEDIIMLMMIMISFQGNIGSRLNVYNTHICMLYHHVSIGSEKRKKNPIQGFSLL